MNVASIAPGRNHLVDSEQAAHGFGRDLDGVFQRLCIRPCRLDGSVDPCGGDAIVAASGTMRSPEVEKHIEPVSSRVLDERTWDGFERARVGFHRQPTSASGRFC